MKDLKIVFEIINDKMNVDVKTDTPEDFVAGIAWLLMEACKHIDIDVSEAVNAISDIVTNVKK